MQVPKVPGIPHYSTISRRINRLEIKINEKLGNDIVIALDIQVLKSLIVENGYDTNGMLEKVT